MTLRQYLAQNRYGDYYGFLLFAPVICVPLSLYIAWRLGGTPIVMVIVAGANFVAFIAGHQLFRLIRCPRCSKRLGELGYTAVMSNIEGRRWGLRRDIAIRRTEKLGKCPNCGLRLDEALGPAKPEGIGRD
jgi:DNA-directed RNA polymerase subunit RPC12/RpoP